MRLPFHFLTNTFNTEGKFDNMLLRISIQTGCMFSCMCYLVVNFNVLRLLAIARSNPIHQISLAS